MPREFAKITLAIWNDDEFRKLPGAAQHLYFTLLTHASLSYAGVGDWRPGRLAQLSSDGSAASVRAAARVLEERLYVVTDDETEEVLARTFIRHDEIMRHARLSVSMTKAFAEVASTKIRGVIVHELNRIMKAQPDLQCWTHSAVLDVLDCDSLDPAVLASGLGSGLASTLDSGLGSGLDSGLGQTPTAVKQGPTTTTSTTTSTLQHSQNDEPHSRPVNIAATKLAKTYTDKVKLVDKARVSATVANAQFAGYSDAAITEALNRLAASKRSCTPETLRIELDGPIIAASSGRAGVSAGGMQWEDG